MFDPDDFVINKTPTHEMVLTYLKDRKLTPVMIDIIPDSCKLKNFVYTLFRVCYPVDQAFIAALYASNEDDLEESFNIYINKVNSNA